MSESLLVLGSVMGRLGISSVADAEEEEKNI
jgi:hypothetical protein